MTYEGSERVDKAEELFRDRYGLQGEPVLPEETFNRRRDMDYVVQEYKKVPVNFGLELEQDYDNRGWDITPNPRNLGEITEMYGYDWEKDFHGSTPPMETQLPGGEKGTNISSMRYPGVFILRFLENYPRKDVHRWVGERSRGSQAFGSHIHFSARTEEQVGEEYPVEYPYPVMHHRGSAWATLWNTLIEMIPLTRILWAWGGIEDIHCHRADLSHWADSVSVRYQPESVYRKFLRDPEDMGVSKSDNLQFHPVIPRSGIGETGYKKDSLTIEMRGNEAHMSVSYFYMILLNRIFRKAIENKDADDWASPKMSTYSGADVAVYEDPRTGMREPLNRKQLHKKLAHLSKKSYSYIRDGTVDDIWDLYSHIKDITFLDDRPIPGVGNQFSDLVELHDRVLKNHSPIYPPLARIGVFYLQHANPFDAPYRFWYTYKDFGEFDWRSAIPEYSETV